MKVAIVMLVALVGCKHRGEVDVATGTLCFAANPPELLRWTRDGKEVDFTEGKPMTLTFRGRSIAVPNAQVGFRDAREGETVAVMRGDERVQSWNVNFQRLGTDLCYYVRAFDPARPEVSPGWVLDADTPHDRCTCDER